MAQTQRLVEEAIARFMPDHAAERREKAADGRYFGIDHDQVSFTGTSRVHGELDLADALDLEDAVAAGADQLKALGSEDPLDVRRAAAVGILARGQQTLNLEPGKGGFETGARAPSSTTGGAGVPISTTGTGGAGVLARREVVLYLHLTADAIRSNDPDVPVWVENAGGRLLTAAQIADWCRREDTARVVVKPVLDLNTQIATDGYPVPERIAEQVRLRAAPVCIPTATGRPGPATWTTSCPTTTPAHRARRRPTNWPACAGSITG